MKEFTEIIKIIENLKPYFYDYFKKNINKVIDEFDLIKNVLDSHLFLSDTDYYLEIFVKHFITFHVLYKIQFEFYKNENLYLHIFSTKIILVKIPENKNVCFYFDENKLRFCCLPPDTKSKNCIFHYQPITNLPAVNSLRDYYLDLENLFLVSSEKVKNILNSYWKFAFDQKYYKKQLKILDLHEPLSVNKIKKSFREKIKLNKNNKEKSIQLIEAYKFLINLFL